MATIPDALNVALRRHQAGLLQEAEALYRQVLQAHPNQPDALHLLGVIAHQVGRNDAAVDCILAAIKLNPSVAEYRNNLGEAYRALGKLDDAIASFRLALVYRPSYPEAYNNLGIALQAQGKLEDAVSAYRQALAHNTAYPEANNNLGIALQAQGKNEDAVSAYRQALKRNPAFAEPHYNLGLMLHKEGKLNEAITHYCQALALKPTHAEACNNLGLVLQERGKLEEAVGLYQQAIALKPAFAEAHSNLGAALQEQGKLQEAVEAYRHALAHQPTSAQAYNNLGVVFEEQGRLTEAVAAYRQALALKPAYVDALYNLGNALQSQGLLSEAVTYYRRALKLDPTHSGSYNNLGNALRDQGKPQEAEESYRRALAIKPGDAMMHSNLLFALNYDRADAAAVAYGYKEWNDHHARPLAAQIRLYQNNWDPDRRLRVGYVSADFLEHPVTYFIEPLLGAHDRKHVEVFCYSNGSRADATTDRLQALADAWRSVARLTDESVAEMIRADKIDILVDLSGHTAGNRLMVFARKPAPVQVTHIGLLTTTGLETIDYRLTDRFLTPADTTESFSEELVRLPGRFCCYRPSVGAPTVAPLPASANGYVTFGSFNNLVKVTPAMVALWSQILRHIPKARLILKGKTLADPAQRARYHELFTQNGIETDRVDLQSWKLATDYLTSYGRVDIGLDPFPYNGCTTTCEALWMGVPVVTLAGVMSYGRCGVSLLSSLGLDNLVTTTPELYVAKAVTLANDREILEKLHSELRPRMAASSLCDAKAYAQDVERAYRLMWHRKCAKYLHAKIK